MVNSQWYTTTLGECAALISGGTPSKQKPEYWGGTIPWVSAKDMKQFRLYQTEDYITENGAENGTRVVPAGTILILVRGMTLHNDIPICIIKRDMGFNQDVKAIQPNPLLVDVEYLAYSLLANKPYLMSIVDSASHGTGRINTDILKAVQIELPPLPEQKAIAHILGTIDDKIELNREMNRTLEAMARAIFKSWFVDFDPVRAKMEGRLPAGMDAATAELFPDEFEESALGMIPKGWKISTIGESVKVVGGGTPSTKNPDYWDGGTIHWTTPKDLASLQSPVLLDTERKITEQGLKQISSGLLPKGTVLLSSRAPIGYLAISEVPVAINQGYIAMVCDGQLSNYYILHWVQQNIDIIKGRANGTTFLEISKSNFRPIELIIPESKILQAFTLQVEALHHQIVNNLNQSHTLVSIRDTLLPKLLSGEIRIKEAEKLVETVA